MKINLFALLIPAIVLLSCSSNKQEKSYTPPKADSCLLPTSGASTGDYYANKTSAAITIDGQSNEPDWHKATWKDISYKWLGEDFTPQDFQGRYKILWDEKQLYFLVEIVDNMISDQHKDPFDNWWEDDCLELFIDEDKSGGDHQYNYNAFAYHITLDGDVVDLGPDKKPRLFNDHVSMKRTVKGKISTWEVSMKVYPSTFKDNANTTFVRLGPGKKMGFAVSYNDNDGTGVRQNFIGSIEIKGEDKNRGWIDAGVFGELELLP